MGALFGRATRRASIRQPIDALGQQLAKHDDNPAKGGSKDLGAEEMDTDAKQLLPIRMAGYYEANIPYSGTAFALTKC